MKSFVCLVTAALIMLIAIVTPSHAAFMPWYNAAASIGLADANDQLLIPISGPRGGNRNVNRQGFNANNFHSNVNANRNTNVNVNRNTNVNRNVVVRGGGCCNGYGSGPSWGGVAAGVAVGAAVGAAVTSAAQPPPTYYPPGSVYVPAY